MAGPGQTSSLTMGCIPCPQLCKHRETHGKHFHQQEPKTQCPARPATTPHIQRLQNLPHPGTAVPARWQVAGNDSDASPVTRWPQGHWRHEAVPASLISKPKMLGNASGESCSGCYEDEGCHRTRACSCLTCWHLYTSLLFSLGQNDLSSPPSSLFGIINNISQYLWITSQAGKCLPVPHGAGYHTAVLLPTPPKASSRILAWGRKGRGSWSPSSHNHVVMSKTCDNLSVYFKITRDLTSAILSGLWLNLVSRPCTIKVGR